MSNSNENINNLNNNNHSTLNEDNNKIENTDKINEKKEIILDINEDNNDNKIIKNNDNNTNENNTNNNNENNNLSDSFGSDSFQIEDTCILCFTDILSPELESNKLPCSHLFCSDCYFEYLKEKINSNLNITSIGCMQYKCPTILTKEFILNQIKKDEALSKKYEKFLNKAINLQNSNKKNCPETNCESFLEYKNDNNYYLTCENGHQYCYKCLRKWHGKKKCSKLIEKDFNKWKKGKIVKQCPKCGMWTEKIEGCNHMTCIECKYQWCWLCRGAYSEIHFVIGRCAGLQYNERKYFQNKFCILLYNFLMFFIIRICLWIIGPYLITYYFIIDTIENELYDIISKDIQNFCLYFMCISNIFFTAVYYPLIFVIIGVFIIIPITLIPPLLECVMRYIERKDNNDYLHDLI